MRPDGFEERAAAVISTFAPDALPVTWWVGPSSRPLDVRERLRGLGLREEEVEFGMILDLARPLPVAETPPEATIETVGDAASLEAWQDVMAAAYDWPPEGGKRRLYRALFGRDLATGTATRRHFLVRSDGRPAAASSLYIAAGHAFVTNIGTAPWARGRGLGTLATVATLQHARQLGFRAAVLTASVDGRGLYLRLGFREYGLLERFTAGLGFDEGSAPAATS